MRLTQGMNEVAVNGSCADQAKCAQCMKQILHPRNGLIWMGLHLMRALVIINPILSLYAQSHKSSISYVRYNCRGSGVELETRGRLFLTGSAEANNISKYIAL